jgi:hypothetical protein
MRIVLDAMGSDTCPKPEIAAAVESARLFGDEIMLVGPIEDLKSRLKTLGASEGAIRLVDAPEIITMKDKGMALALKAKRKNRKPPWQSARFGQVSEADAFVTAGNTGGAMTTAYFRLGTIPVLNVLPWQPLSRSRMDIALFLISVQTPIVNQSICSNLPSWVQFMLIRHVMWISHASPSFPMERKRARVTNWLEALIQCWRIVD